MLGLEGQKYPESSQFRPYASEAVSPRTKNSTIGISLSFLAEIFQMMVPPGFQLQWNPENDDTKLDYWFPQKAIANAIALFLDYIAKDFDPKNLKKGDFRKDNLNLPEGEAREHILVSIKNAIEQKLMGNKVDGFEKIEGLYLAILGWYGIIFHMEESLIEDWLFLRQNPQSNIRPYLESKYKTTPSYILDIFTEFLKKVKDSGSIEFFCREFSLVILKMQFTNNLSGLTDEELRELLYTENLSSIIKKIAEKRSTEEHITSSQIYSEVGVKAKLFFNSQNPEERVTIDIRFDKIEVLRESKGSITQVRISDFKSKMMDDILTLSAGELLQWVINIVVASALVSKLSRDPVKGEDDFKFFLVEVKLWELADLFKHADKLARVKQSWVPTGVNVEGAPLDFVFSLVELKRVFASVSVFFKALLNNKKEIAKLRKAESKEGEYPGLAFPKPPSTPKVKEQSTQELSGPFFSSDPEPFNDSERGELLADRLMDGIDLIERYGENPALKIMENGKLTVVKLFKARGSSFTDAQLQYVFNGPDVLSDSDFCYGISGNTLYIVINGEVVILKIPKEKYFSLRGVNGIFCLDQHRYLIYLSKLTSANLPGNLLNVRVSFERKQLPGFQKTNGYAFYDGKYYPVFKYEEVTFIKVSVNVYLLIDTEGGVVYCNRTYTSKEIITFSDACITRRQWDKVFGEIERGQFPVELYCYNDQHGNPQNPVVKIGDKYYLLSKDNTFVIAGIAYGLYLDQGNEVMAYRLNQGFNGSMLEEVNSTCAIEQ